MTQKWTAKGCRHGWKGSHLQVFLILVVLFMWQRIPLGTEAFPMPGLTMKIFIFQGEIGQYSCPHPQSRSEFLGFLLDVFSPSSDYSQKVLSRVPVNHHLRWRGRAICQEETKICHDISKSKKSSTELGGSWSKTLLLLVLFLSLNQEALTNEFLKNVSTG